MLQKKRVLASIQTSVLVIIELPMALELAIGVAIDPCNPKTVAPKLGQPLPGIPRQQALDIARLNGLAPHAAPHIAAEQWA